MVTFHKSDKQTYEIEHIVTSELQKRLPSAVVYHVLLLCLVTFFATQTLVYISEE